MKFLPLDFFVGVQNEGNSGIFQVYIGGQVWCLVTLFHDMITRKYRHINTNTFIYIKILAFIKIKKLIPFPPFIIYSTNSIIKNIVYTIYSVNTIYRYLIYIYLYSNI